MLSAWGECQAAALWGRRKEGNGLHVLQATICKPCKPKTVVAAPSSEMGTRTEGDPRRAVTASRHCQPKALQGLSQQLFLSLCNSNTEATIRLLHHIDLFRGLHLLLQPHPMWAWQEQGLNQGDHSTKSTAADKDYRGKKAPATVMSFLFGITGLVFKVASCSLFSLLCLVQQTSNKHLCIIPYFNPHSLKTAFWEHKLIRKFLDVVPKIFLVNRKLVWQESMCKI